MLCTLIVGHWAANEGFPEIPTEHCISFDPSRCFHHDTGLKVPAADFIRKFDSDWPTKVT